MHTSKQWIDYFTLNATRQRVDWRLQPRLSTAETKAILHSLQAWQLGETSDGKNLIRAASRYALHTGDPAYLEAVVLFIKEEQKHGDNLGRYLDAIGEKRIDWNWGDALFRAVRYFNTSMESWTLAVVVVESTAQVFYQSLKDATGCALLRQICTDILIDEAAHITFQTERLAVLFDAKTPMAKAVYRPLYKYFFFAVSLLVWVAHRRLFRAGGNTFFTYLRKIHYKYYKTVDRITAPHDSLVVSY